MTQHDQPKASRPGPPGSGLWAALVTLALTLTVMASAPALATAADAADAAALPPLELSRDGVTVSGLSSGGYRVGQVQVAFSGLLSGAAVLAAGP